MSKFDNQEEDEDWKARNALKRFGKAELERSDKEWAKKEPAAGKEKGGGWLLLAFTTLIIVLCIFHA